MPESNGMIPGTHRAGGTAAIVLFAASVGMPILDVNGAEPQFVDVARAAGVTFRHENGATGRLHYPEIMGAGVALFDYDGDGDIDVYLVNGNALTGTPPDPNPRNRLYRNDTAGPGAALRFTDVTTAAGVGDSGYGQGAEAADFDGDGDLDLYVTNVGANVLYRNNGDGTFMRTAVLADPGWGQCAAAFDYDRDGDLDLYLVNYLIYDAATEPLGTGLIAGKIVHDYRGPYVYAGQADVLFRNDGNLRFVDATDAAGLSQPGGKGMGLACVDFDRDGDVDIFVANDSMANYLFVNEGGRFSEQGLLSGAAVSARGGSEASMGVDVADVDVDGRIDVMVPCLDIEVHTLYHNEWPFFSDVSSERGFRRATRGFTGFSPTFLDYDNDGDADLLITCGRVAMRGRTAGMADAGFEDRYGEPDLLLENVGRGRFRRVEAATAGPHFARTLVGRGSAVGDLDNDGRLDVVINNAAGPAVILHNTGRTGHWLTLDLVGTRSPRSAIGARVTVTAGALRQHFIVRGGGSYLSCSDRRVHVGLGESVTVDQIKIVWPTGTRQTLSDVKVDQILTVTEPTSR